MVAEVMRTIEPQERVPWPRIVALLASIAQKASCTSFLAAVLRGMPAEARGSHGQPTDAAGCAAMPCEEVVVHGYDIRGGSASRARRRRTWHGTCATSCFHGPRGGPLDDAAVV